MQKKSSFKRVASKTIRWDSAPGGAGEAGPSAAARKGGVLELFRAWIRSAPAERRQATRHSAGGKLWVGWWDGNRVFTAVSADVINISRGGALVCSAEPPRELREVWVCLDVAEPGDCVPASVLSAEPIRPGAWAVRFEFSAPCPRAFLAATLGTPARRPVGRG
jgi:hypothetical protein